MNSEAKLKRPQFLNVRELADMLRTKLRTIYDWVSQGRIPCRKVGDRTIFLLDKIPDEQTTVAAGSNMRVAPKLHAP
jgi:excisionase family DNA binding protein